MNTDCWVACARGRRTPRPDRSRPARAQLTRMAVSLSGLDRQVFTLFFLWCARRTRAGYV
jgi:hypothetical protein